ncbi:MAG: sigma-70 family RNA polymerase sigma factor [Rubrivivax sp.]|nr:MAG: sigma-70 family RNA polymerase sigma factor [Rubrivivax sp.]
MAYMPLVKMIAGTLYAARSFDGVPFEEYVQYGAEGLIHAFKRYDPAQGVKFESYASHRIRGAIVNGLEKATEVNQQVSTMRRMAKERIDSLAASQPALPGKKLSPQESFDRLVEVSLGLAVAYMLDDSSLFSNRAPTHWDDGASNLAYKQLQTRLLAAVQLLGQNEQKVLDQHYFQHEPFDLIAQNLGLTKGRISQLHRSALTKLRATLAASHLGELIG